MTRSTVITTQPTQLRPLVSAQTFVDPFAADGRVIEQPPQGLLAASSYVPPGSDATTVAAKFAMTARAGAVTAGILATGCGGQIPGLPSMTFGDLAVSVALGVSIVIPLLINLPGKLAEEIGRLKSPLTDPHSDINVRYKLGEYEATHDHVIARLSNRTKREKCLPFDHLVWSEWMVRAAHLSELAGDKVRARKEYLLAARFLDYGISKEDLAFANQLRFFELDRESSRYFLSDHSSFKHQLFVYSFVEHLQSQGFIFEGHPYAQMEFEELSAVVGAIHLYWQVTSLQEKCENARYLFLGLYIPEDILKHMWPVLIEHFGDIKLPLFSGRDILPPDHESMIALNGGGEETDNPYEMSVPKGFLGKKVSAPKGSLDTDRKAAQAMYYFRANGDERDGKIEEFFGKLTYEYDKDYLLALIFFAEDVVANKGGRFGDSAIAAAKRWLSDVSEREMILKV